jgi:hypothetical protein
MVDCSGFNFDRGQLAASELWEHKSVRTANPLPSCNILQEFSTHCINIMGYGIIWDMGYDNLHVCVDMG